jgi:hypothetical protein
MQPVSPYATVRKRATRLRAATQLLEHLIDEQYTDRQSFIEAVNNIREHVMWIDAEIAWLFEELERGQQ